MHNANQKAHALTVFGQPLKEPLLSIRALLASYWPHVFLGFVLLLITNLIIVALPLLINAAISLIENKNNTSWQSYFSSVYSVLAYIIILAISVGVIRTLSRVVIFDVGRSIEKDVRALVFNRMCVMDDNFLLRHGVGDIMNHLTSDITNIRMITGFAVLNIMNIFFIFIFTVPLLFRIDTTLACCALLPFPLVMIAMSNISKKMFETTKFYQERLSSLVNHVQENLLGAHVIRLFHQQDAENTRFSIVNNNAYEASLSLARVRMFMMPLMRLVIGSALALIVFVGGKAIIAGRISLGDFVEINTRILQLTWPAMSVGFVMSIFSRGQASLERLNKLISQTPLIYDGTCKLEDLHEIKINGLKLNKNQKQDIFLELKKGQLLGIVGVSGSYKSTLLKSIYRRILVPDKNIFFNKQDINNIDLRSFYQNIAVVTQEPVLFHKSIRENISFASPDASEEEIQKVLHITRLSEDIKYAPSGLDTIVGERGITLSGGQRQRIALARALLAKRALLILDDALSAVDADTESHILSQIKNYLTDAMLIIATHRLAAIKDAHEIIVLDKGAILARGKHEELLHSCELYRELWGAYHE